MKSLIYGSVSILFFGVLLLAGCGTHPAPIVKGSGLGKKSGRTDDVYRQLPDTFRYPENPRISDDWTRFREGLTSLAPSFAQTTPRLSADERKFLEGEESI